MKVIFLATVLLFIVEILGLPYGESSLPYRQYSATREQFASGFVPIINPYTSRAGDYYAQNARSDGKNPEVAEQNFFPSFFRNPTTHSRPYKSVASNAGSIAGRYRASGRSQNFDQTILGSGDFAVIRGGTFYSNDDQNAYQFKNSEEFFSGFYNNGHGRPNAQPLKAKKQPYYPDDPFEHFTDFADINTGNEAAFSSFNVIYANKNSTNSHQAPKNIFEKLQLLDFEKKLQRKDDEEIYNKKLIKTSNFKAKLARTKLVKKYTKKQGPKRKDASTDYKDPLLATS